ncbi:3-phosphoserine/phosphohydroxythreonine transaminase [Mucilaginibacter sp. KACC 22773]|uniref:3-phosphoserine/phosphohydroxythreonine transaminase n=1 Tax=Mucilaginibacter sp. KACC 22773 TaxID=3025671 RepID=UPI002366ACB2|nr:3-phosphoserine/phosphohydroxythreonine transaminase [Mucilaginibacter sp. KACC 22773]WDF77156.1 3-phosphoserine/phosphohydroxythreonine transaminase [Mucilaginibacter sp. KACC 22773]
MKICIVNRQLFITMTQSQKHNFGAGPCILPQPVLERAAEAVRAWDRAGLSILEISHRSAEFESVVHETERLVRELLSVPDGYSILFLQGGASMQFCMVPMNFLQGSKQTAAYLDGGYFGAKAIKEAQFFGKVNVLASSKDSGYTFIPEAYVIPEDAAYFHYTSNNTIEGTQLWADVTSSVPVVCDMSSDIFSREINVSQFSLIYAGAQKNTGPAGLTIVIAKNEFLDSVKHAIPSMLDYRVFRDNGSMYNTPPVFAIYAAMLNLQWLKGKGGVKSIAKENVRKAQLLYDEIDRNPLFKGSAARGQRSLMNVTFRMNDQAEEADFLAYAAKCGMVGIKGYRTVGGFRASLYNALPYESVQALVQCMTAYAEKVVPQHNFQPTY